MRAVTSATRTKNGYNIVARNIMTNKLVPHLFVCDPDLFEKAVCEYNSGQVIQRCFNFLSADEREFLLTGLSPEEWGEMTGE